MTVSERPYAAQIVAAGEEPLFFDDLGCLRDYLAGGGRVPEGAAAFVADRRTASWVAAGRAVYSLAPELATPMGSHLVAHADAASRDRDGAVTGAVAVPAAAIFGASALAVER